MQLQIKCLPDKRHLQWQIYEVAVHQAVGFGTIEHILGCKLGKT